MHALIEEFGEGMLNRSVAGSSANYNTIVSIVLGQMYDCVVSIIRNDGEDIVVFYEDDKYLRLPHNSTYYDVLEAIAND